MPDLCRYVFACSHGDWQVQVSPGARSDLGGAAETYQALAEAHRVHLIEDHTEGDVDQMQAELAAMGAPARLANPGEGLKSSYMHGSPLPLWWRD